MENFKYKKKNVRICLVINWRSCGIEKPSAKMRIG